MKTLDSGNIEQKMQFDLRSTLSSISLKLFAENMFTTRVFLSSFNDLKRIHQIIKKVIMKRFHLNFPIINPVSNTTALRYLLYRPKYTLFNNLQDNFKFLWHSRSIQEDGQKDGSFSQTFSSLSYANSMIYFLSW